MLFIFYKKKYKKMKTKIKKSILYKINSIIYFKNYYNHSHLIKTYFNTINNNYI